MQKDSHRKQAFVISFLKNVAKKLVRASKSVWKNNPSGARNSKKIINLTVIFFALYFLLQHSKRCSGGFDEQFLLDFCYLKNFVFLGPFFTCGH